MQLLDSTSPTGTMRALLFDGPAADTSRTTVRAVPIPRPGAGEILVRIAHAGVNFKDVMARRGDPGYVDAWPFIPGLEAAGQIVELGDGVSGLRVGDRVAALTNTGAMAEYVTARADLAAVLPDGLDTASAATAAGAWTTAMLLTDHVGRVRDGDTLLVHSAAGAVGTAIAAVSRARAAVRLVGTVGSEGRVRAAEAAGYDIALVRGADLAQRVTAAVGEHAVDLVFDSQGTNELETDFAVLAPGGTTVLFGNASGAPLTDLPSASRVIGANAAVAGFSLSALSRQRPRLIAATMASVLVLLRDKTLHADITELAGLDQVPAAHQALASGAGETKYVVRLEA